MTITNIISFVRNIDSARNDLKYFDLMKMLRIDGKIKKNRSWLDKIRPEQHRKQPEEGRTMKENIHVTIQKLKPSNPWFLKIFF
jgi:hypothetical protein